jgi:hypothetical protein
MIQAKRKPALRFAVLLPLIQCMIAIGSLAAVTLQIHRVTEQTLDPKTHQTRTTQHYTADPLDVSPLNSGEIRIVDIPKDFSNPPLSPFQIISIANLPGMIGEILESVPTTWPDTRYPEFFDMWQWRAITWPLFASPFGWLAGRAIDSMRGRAVRVRAWEAFPLLAFSLFLSTFVVVGVFTGTIHDRDSLSLGILGGATLWAVLCLLSPLAWFLQFRSPRRLAPQPL